MRNKVLGSILVYIRLLQAGRNPCGIRVIKGKGFPEARILGSQEYPTLQK